LKRMLKIVLLDRFLNVKNNTALYAVSKRHQQLHPVAIFLLGGATAITRLATTIHAELRRYTGTAIIPKTPVFDRLQRTFPV